VAALTLVAAAMTQLIYPYLYGPLLQQELLAVALLVARTLVVVGLLAVMVVEAAAASRPRLNTSSRSATASAVRDAEAV
jgi:multisubunit Na+/H+ antiporter MnhF subunit